MHTGIAVIFPQSHPGIRSGRIETVSVPLCVDLDGTLIDSDLLWECILQLLKKNPLCLFLIPFWLMKGGRPYLKRQLAQRTSLQPENIPYNQELLDFLLAERDHGRQLILVTATDQQLAEKIAAHTPIFDHVYGTRAGQNLRGQTKAEFLQTLFGERAFDYAGDSSSDMHVWRVSRGAYVVGSETTASRVASVTEVHRCFARKGGDLGCWARAIRVHHWSKNLLMLAALLLAHRLSWHPLVMTLLGMVFFGLCSSGVYIVNDLLDLHSDREHPWKKERPFASGRLSIAAGAGASVILFGAAFALGAAVLNWRFVGVMALYAVAAIWYSLQLKRIAVLDVFVLSSFYSIRIWAGALITQTPLSQWLLGFSLFFFLSLAMAKRYSELMHAADLADSGNSGRNYRVADRELLLSIGIASCFSAIVILSLYVHSNEVVVLYRRPEILLLLCPLILYWTSYIWLKAHRGELNEDPVTLAMRDSVSYGVAAAGLAIMMLSSLNF